MERDDAVVKKIIRRYGKVIDLEKEPGTIIDIIRQFAIGDGGAPPGGVPPSPPPGPTSFQDDLSNRDVMRELLKLSRAVAKLDKRLG